MADNVAITAGSGTVVASDEITINAIAAQVQRVKMVAGKDGTYIGDVSGRLVDGDTNASAHFTDNRRLVTRNQATSAGLTIASTAYTSGDQLGTILSFTSAVRAAAGTGVINGITLLDEGDVLGAVDLLFFRNTVTLAADNAAFSVSDTDMRACAGLVSLSAPVGLTGNRIATASLQGRGIAFDCAATTLFCAMVTRSANAVFTAVGDIKVTLFIAQD